MHIRPRLSIDTHARRHLVALPGPLVPMNEVEGPSRQRRRPPQHGSSARRWLNREGATSVTGPFTQLDQPTASDIAGDPSAVVDDLDGQLVFHVDVDAEWWWRWRAGQLADRFADNRFGM